MEGLNILHYITEEDSIEQNEIKSSEDDMKEITISFRNFWQGFQEDKVYSWLTKTLFEGVAKCRVVSENADIGFSSAFGNNKLDGKVKILFLGENWPVDFKPYHFSISHIRSNNIGLCCNLTWPLFAIYYDLTVLEKKSPITFREESLSAPSPLSSLTSISWEKNVRISSNDSIVKSKFCSFIVSNGSCSSRNSFFDRVSEYKHVDSGGRYRNNIGHNIPGIHSDPEIISFIKDYRFNICFENSSTEGYCTEKIVQSMVACTIPIYSGDPRVNDYFNPKSFINVDSYSTKEEAINKIKELEEDHDKYREMYNEPWIKDDFLSRFSPKVLKKFAEKIVRRLDH
jgi:hypothetical protein